MKRVGVVGAALLGCILMSGAAHAEIFKWVDADGKVHFSDRKISSQAQKVNVKTGAKTLNKNDVDKNIVSNVSQDDQNAEQRLLQQKKYVNFLTSERLERQEKRKEAQQEKDKKRKLCAAMQDQLNGYTQGNYRWYELNEETGERDFLADEKIEARKHELQSDIKSNCS
ncbi:MAG: DUF4124 domain-containing protein [Gammaproteobacteria bacterium]